MKLRTHSPFSSFGVFGINNTNTNKRFKQVQAKPALSHEAWEWREWNVRMSHKDLTGAVGSPSSTSRSARADWSDCQTNERTNKVFQRKTNRTVWDCSPFSARYNEPCRIGFERLTIAIQIKEKEKELRILILGLDNAGKTTIVRRWTGQSIDSVQPTLGFSIHTVPFQEFQLHLWDIGGQRSIRSYWRNYFDSEIDGIVWVVDSVDEFRMETMAEELNRLLQNERWIETTTCLVLANKQDVDGAVSIEALAKALPQQRRHWKIFPCSAVTGEGLAEAMKWMVEDMASRIFLLA